MRYASRRQGLLTGLEAEPGASHLVTIYGSTERDSGDQGRV